MEYLQDDDWMDEENKKDRHCKQRRYGDRSSRMNMKIDQRLILWSRYNKYEMEQTEND